MASMVTPRPGAGTAAERSTGAPVTNELSSRPTWAELDPRALRANLRRVRQCARGRRVIAVVKADAYGHGAIFVGRTLVQDGVDALAVATLEEARALRGAGLGLPILLLEGLHRAEDAAEIVARRLVPVITRPDMIPALELAARSAGVRLGVHLKLDTGMGRLGLMAHELGGAVDALASSQALELEGVMTHLSESDDGRSPITDRQRRLFSELVRTIRARGLEPAWIHADPSAAVLRGPTDEATAVRPGLMLYGADPTLDGGMRLDPVMTLYTRVIRAVDVPAGTRVGYGGTHTTTQPTRLLTLPIGYADGLPRAAGGRALVGLEGRRVPLVGRVSMDLCVIDAGPRSRADVGSNVVIFGRAGAQSVPVEDLAESVGTIAYEIFTRVGDRVPRVVRG